MNWIGVGNNNIFGIGGGYPYQGGGQGTGGYGGQNIPLREYPKVDAGRREPWWMNAGAQSQPYPTFNTWGAPTAYNPYTGFNSTTGFNPNIFGSGTPPLNYFNNITPWWQQQQLQQQSTAPVTQPAAINNGENDGNVMGTDGWNTPVLSENEQRHRDYVSGYEAFTDKFPDATWADYDYEKGILSAQGIPSLVGGHGPGGWADKTRNYMNENLGGGLTPNRNSDWYTNEKLQSGLFGDVLKFITPNLSWANWDLPGMVEKAIDYERPPEVTGLSTKPTGSEASWTEPGAREPWWMNASAQSQPAPIQPTFAPITNIDEQLGAYDNIFSKNTQAQAPVPSSHNPLFDSKGYTPNVPIIEDSVEREPISNTVSFIASSQGNPHTNFGANVGLNTDKVGTMGSGSSWSPSYNKNTGYGGF